MQNYPENLRHHKILYKELKNQRNKIPKNYSNIINCVMVILITSGADPGFLEKISNLQRGV